MIRIGFLWSMVSVVFCMVPLHGVHVLTHAKVSTKLPLLAQLKLRFTGVTPTCQCSVEQGTIELRIPEVTVEESVQFANIMSALKRTGLVEDARYQSVANGDLLFCIRTRPGSVVVRGPVICGTHQIMVELYSMHALEKIRKAHDGPLLFA